MFQVKSLKLEKFREIHGAGPAQGSAAWLAGREESIGGADLKNLMSNPKELIRDKLGLKPRFNNVQMSIGNVFEHVLRDTMTYILKSDIHETSSIPSALVPGKHYSPDGLAVVNLLCDRWNDIPYEFRMHFIALFEFKIVYSREIKHGQVFPAYVPQIMSGMSDLQIPELCIYCEGNLRMAEFEDLDNTPSCIRWLQPKPNPHQLTPISYGFLGLYCDVKNPTVAEDYQLLLNSWLEESHDKHKLIDFAKLGDQKQLNALFQLIKSGDVKVWSSQRYYSSQRFLELKTNWLRRQRRYPPDQTVDMDTELIKFFREGPPTRARIGIIGFKLFDLNIVTVQKDPQYTLKYKELIVETVQNIKKIKATCGDDMDKRELMLEELYPTKCMEEDVFEGDPEIMQSLLDSMLSF
jgi:hypothetical protein